MGFLFAPKYSEVKDMSRSATSGEPKLQVPAHGVMRGVGVLDGWMSIPSGATFGSPLRRKSNSCLKFRFSISVLRSLKVQTERMFENIKTRIKFSTTLQSCFSFKSIKFAGSLVVQICHFNNDAAITWILLATAI